MFTMSLLFDVISAIILATIGCGATYWYLDNQGYEEKKGPVLNNGFPDCSFCDSFCYVSKFCFSLGS